MTKKMIFKISIVVNILLVIALVITLPGALDSLNFEYVEQETIRPDTIRSYLGRENYGTAASLSREIRGGAKIDQQYEVYRLGEYAELLFLKEVYEKAGNIGSAKNAEDRINAIRSQMSEYNTVFDKIDKSAANAVRK